MSTPFRLAIAEIAKRVNAFKSTASASTADSDFNTSPLTTTQIDSIIHNLALLQNIVADVHGDLAWAIAAAADANGIGQHPWRVHFADLTANVSHGGTLPTVSASSKTIIGAFGRPYDAADTDLFLSPSIVERISAFRANTGIFTNNPNLYALNGTKVYHTTTNVIFECCSYERADTLTLITSNSSFGTGAASRTIPDVLMPALVAGGVVMAVVEDELIPQAQVYAVYYQDVLKRIAAGITVMPSLPIIQGVAA